MNKDVNIGTVILRCDCNCSMLVIDKYIFNELNEVNYNICIQDSYFSNLNNIKSRIKRAFKILFGKPISYNDIYIEKEEDIIEFRDNLNKLIEKR